MSTTHEELEYSGETKERSRHVARVLAWLCPGLGYMYIGRWIRGLIVNLLFVLVLEVFILLETVYRFFPLLPLVVLVVAWVVFSAFAVSDVKRLVAEENAKGEYLLRGYNHPVVYLLFAVLTYFAPLAISLHTTMTYVWDVTIVDNSAMYPTVLPGDVVLIDQLIYRKRPPKRGEVVAIDTPGGGTQLLRVVGVEGDTLRIEGDMVFINEEPVERLPLPDAPDSEAKSRTKSKEDILAMIESNQDQRYVISVSKRVFNAVSLPALELGPQEYFLLADNRSQIPVPASESVEGQRVIRDSRNFGPVNLNILRGKPLFIAWSRSALSEASPLERVGLRIQ